MLIHCTFVTKTQLVEVNSFGEIVVKKLLNSYNFNLFMLTHTLMLTFFIFLIPSSK